MSNPQTKDIEEVARQISRSMVQVREYCIAFNRSFEAGLKKGRRLRFSNRWLLFWRFYYWMKGE